MRARITPSALASFFNAVKQKHEGSWQTIAQLCSVTPRTVAEWRKGTHTVPIAIIDLLATTYAVSKPATRILSNHWHASRAGKLGGQSTFKKYGALGTPESRMRGTLRSLCVHRALPTGCFAPRAILTPPHSALFAEFIGILLGDGGLTPTQATITLHSEDDREYIAYVADAALRLFGIRPSIRKRNDERACSIVISRVRLISFLEQQGLVVGNKVRRQAGIPLWIRDKQEYIYSCARGLFDTDGSVYVDIHRYPKKTYLNCGMIFSNHSLPLISFFKRTLEDLGLHPTQTTPFAVFLRKEYDIIAYFNMIGSSNPKHANKIKRFFSDKYGGVPKWS